MRQFLGLAIGLLVGGFGVGMYLQSLPPEQGSPEERAENAVHELKRARKHIAVLEAQQAGTDGVERGRQHGLRSIAADIRAGRRVNLEDVFKIAKPWIRDLAPIFDRIRVRDQKRYFDTVAGEMAREYHLTIGQQERLRDWLDAKAEENATRFREVAEDESTGLEDMIRASRELGERDDIDGIMEQLLDGGDLDRYREDRLRQRAELVQSEADRKVQRLHAVVELDEAQQDEVFVLMARGSRHFDPSMQLEDVGEGESTRLVPGQSRDEAIMAVLRPEQRETYEAHRQERLAEAEEELSEIGLALPEDWDLFEEDDF